MSNKNREIQSPIFEFHEDFTLVSDCPHKNKVMLVVSCMHNDNAIDVMYHVSKPEMITYFYNKTKVGVDLVDQLCRKYNVARNPCRWLVAIFL